MSLAQQILLQIILIAINAFFAATEIAVVSLNTTKLKKMAEDGDKYAPKLLKMAENPTLLSLQTTSQSTSDRFSRRSAFPQAYPGRFRLS